MKAITVISIIWVILFLIIFVLLYEDDNNIENNNYNLTVVMQNSAQSKYENSVTKINSQALRLKAERLQRQQEMQRLKNKEKLQIEQLRLKKDHQNRASYSKKNTKIIVHHDKVASNQAEWQQFNASYYGSDCTGCSGITATGINVRETIYYHGLRIVAVDPTVIPLGTIVEIKTPYESFRAISADKGGAIKGHKLDILVESERIAARYGRHHVQLRIVQYPEK
ncbi:3D domain-containing protein [Lysinibacillus parviboronicapiens]|uniref:3D domain-containing protein n=1 Tax=Lysinibacillus parviboronicapiens TaxID=436516 RepID=UPI000D395A0A|nr:3D domain-containing protein [Lysinibacillus parviboronicapiens]